MKPPSKTLRTGLIVLLLLATATAPLASAGQESRPTITFTAVDAFEFASVQILDGDDARSPRVSSDSNDDGTVSQEEATAATRQLRQALGGTTAPPWPLAGQEMAEWNASAVSQEGLVGEANRTDPLTLTVLFEGSYENVTGDEAELSFVIRPSFPAGTEFTISAPPGRTVQAEEGLENGTTTDDGRTGTFDVTGQDTISVTFAGQGSGRTRDDATPGPGALLVGGAVAAAALLLVAVRRRRQGGAGPDGDRGR